MKVAALEMLEALLRVGGALLPVEQRCQADAVALHMATTAEAASRRLSGALHGDAGLLKDVRLAAYRCVVRSGCACQVLKMGLCFVLFGLAHERYGIRTVWAECRE
jgi:hypothetical protein